MKKLTIILIATHSIYELGLFSINQGDGAFEVYVKSGEYRPLRSRSCPGWPGRGETSY
ncbi:protein of unknown function [uncultured Sphingopyxis sp.]|uniref:Uncharacterized protein n=1 Tax=uncultured Sphingopyxis sp. TaxID=310581 RepID=A0A1Y5PYK0_9SPHN|nr:protein of unknown function [uncultured Sphingopyxis sp.]